MEFAINHISASKLSVQDFFAMVRRLGADKVEIRNDIPDVMNTVAPEDIKAAAEAAGVTILSINALYPFNVWSGDLPARAEKMADYAAACGAKALVMCPLNDGTKVSRNDLVEALKKAARTMTMKQVRMLVMQAARGADGCCKTCGVPLPSTEEEWEEMNRIGRGGGICRCCNPA